MAYDEGVAQRVREALSEHKNITEKKMFGGIAFMLSGNMCVGVVKDQLMLRVGPQQYEELLKMKHVKKMDFTGKAMKGFIYLQPEGFAEDDDLTIWLAKAFSFVSSLPEK